MDISQKRKERKITFAILCVFAREKTFLQKSSTVNGLFIIFLKKGIDKTSFMYYICDFREKQYKIII